MHRPVYDSLGKYLKTLANDLAAAAIAESLSSQNLVISTSDLAAITRKAGATHDAFARQVCVVGVQLDIRVRAVGSFVHGVGPDAVEACGKAEVGHREVCNAYILDGGMAN